jgi:hypothetical protein
MNGKEEKYRSDEIPDKIVISTHGCCGFPKYLAKIKEE